MIHAQSKHILPVISAKEQHTRTPQPDIQWYSQLGISRWQCDSRILFGRMFSHDVSVSILMCTHALFLIESITIHWRRISIRWIFEGMVAIALASASSSNDVPLERRVKLPIVNLHSICASIPIESREREKRESENPLFRILYVVCVFIWSKSLWETSVWSSTSKWFSDRN